MGADLNLIKIIGTPNNSSIPEIGDEQGRQIVHANYGQPVIWEAALGLSAGGAYAAGDVIGNVAGAGLGSVSAVVFKTGFWLGYLNNIRVIDVDAQKPELTILLFGLPPSNSTVTDNAAFAWAGGDESRLSGIVRVLAGDYYTVGTKAFAHLAGLNQLIYGTQGAAVSTANSLYMVVLVQSAATYTANGNLKLSLGFQMQSAPAVGAGNIV